VNTHVSTERAVEDCRGNLAKRGSTADTAKCEKVSDIADTTIINYQLSEAFCSIMKSEPTG
jgi:hypothetical protein